MARWSEHGVGVGSCPIPESETRYRVGDKLKMVNASDNWTRVSLGEVVEVVNLDGGGDAFVFSPNSELARQKGLCVGKPKGFRKIGGISDGGRWELISGGN